MDKTEPREQPTEEPVRYEPEFSPLDFSDGHVYDLDDYFYEDDEQVDFNDY